MLRNMFLGVILALATLVAVPSFAQTTTTPTPTPQTTPAAPEATLHINLLYRISDGDVVATQFQAAFDKFFSENTQNVVVTPGDSDKDDPATFDVRILSISENDKSTFITALLLYHRKGTIFDLYVGSLSGFVTPDNAELAANQTAVRLLTAIGALTADPSQLTSTMPETNAARLAFIRYVKQ